MTPDPDGLEEYVKSLIAVVERVEGRYDKLADDLKKFQLKTTDDTATLKVKCGIWGIIGGMVPVVITLAIALFVFLLKR